MMVVNVIEKRRKQMWMESIKHDLKEGLSGEGSRTQHFCHHRDTICHPKFQTQVIVYKTSACRYNNDMIIQQSFQQEPFSRVPPSTYAGHVGLATVGPWCSMPK